MENIYKEIIKEKKHCYFISPHLDDAYLSSGALMEFLSKKTKVTVINVFTRAGTNSTFSAKKNLKLNGYKNQYNLYRDRRLEDATIYKNTNIEVINLPFVEASWRKKSKPGIVSQLLGKLLPEFLHIYPTYKFHIIKGKISSEDNLNLEAFKKKLSIIKEKDIVFCPVGTGNHVDHIFVRKACEQLFKRPIFWSDFPYNMESQANSNKSIHKFDKNLNLKNKKMKFYKTQISSMFPDGIIPEKSEIFYI